MISQSDEVHKRRFGDVLGRLQPTRCSSDFALVTISDDCELMRPVTAAVQELGLEIANASDLISGMKLVCQLQPCFALIDMHMLAEESPESELGAHLRHHGSRLIAALHRRDRVAAEIVAHADVAEVLFKPVDPEEVRLRISRLLKGIRGSPDMTPAPESGPRPAFSVEAASSRRPRIGCWLLDVALCVLQDAETSEIRQLSSAECRALSILHEHYGNTVSRELFSQHVFGEDWDPRSRRLDALMSRLRRKLNCDCMAHEAIRTDFGRGYRLDI